MKAPPPEVRKSQTLGIGTGGGGETRTSRREPARSLYAKRNYGTLGARSAALGGFNLRFGIFLVVVVVAEGVGRINAISIFPFFKHRFCATDNASRTISICRRMGESNARRRGPELYYTRIMWRGKKHKRRRTTGTCTAAVCIQYYTVEGWAGPSRGYDAKKKAFCRAGVFIIFIFPVSTQTADTLHYNVLFADNATSTFVYIVL